MINNIITAEYVTVWDGGVQVVTHCDFNLETLEVSNIQIAEVDGLDVCEREYVLLPDGTEYDVEDGEVVR